jgi:hypothetical protein
MSGYKKILSKDVKCRVSVKALLAPELKWNKLNHTQSVWIRYAVVVTQMDPIAWPLLVLG